MVERGSPDLVASRPLVLTGVEAVLETDEFARVLRRAAIAAHGLLLHGDRDVIVELEEGTELLIPAVRSVSPEAAGQIPTDLNPRIAAIGAPTPPRRWCASPTRQMRWRSRCCSSLSPC